jgi:hypothetical protein
MLVEPSLHGFKDVFVLPSCDASLLSSGATMFDRAALTLVG